MGRKRKKQTVEVIDDLKREIPKHPNQELRLTLPLAVSVNHLYKFVRGKRFMTKQGQDYMNNVMKIASLEVLKQGYKIEEEGVWLIAELTFYFPDKRVRDCHNQHKLIMDALEYIAFKNDRWVLVRDMHVGLDKENPRVEIRIYPHQIEGELVPTGN